MKPDTRPAVCVIGLGDIGLPTAALAARAGCRVAVVDPADDTVAALNGGTLRLAEVDLDGLVQGAIGRGLLVAATAVAPADVFVIAVPTPFDVHYAPDVSHVLAAGEAVAAVLKAGDTVILESTVPVGTTRQLRDLIAARRPDLACPLPGSANGAPADIAIACCPHRVLSGHVLQEVAGNDRAVGGITRRCAQQALAFYGLFVRGACTATDAGSAELSKLAESAYRDVTIAFANELSMAAEAMGLDPWEVIRLANRHPRVAIPSPGPGVGGPCVGIDPWFMVHAAPDATPLVRTARGVNDGKIHHVVARAETLIAAQPHARIACLGLAYKANVDDLRESPARIVAATLARRFGARVMVAEPHADGLPDEFAGTGARLVDTDTALAQADILIVLVDHDAFRAIPLARRARHTVYDTRGIWPDQPGPAAPAPAGVLRLAS